MIIPDLARYRLHRAVMDAEFEGVAVPGLRADFYHRDDEGRTATVGRYWYGCRELLMAWGYAEEEHCCYFTLRGDDGTWRSPTAGCPTVRVIRDQADSGAVTGLAVRDPHGRWVTFDNASVNATSPSDQ